LEEGEPPPRLPSQKNSGTLSNPRGCAEKEGDASYSARTKMKSRARSVKGSLSVSEREKSKKRALEGEGGGSKGRGSKGEKKKHVLTWGGLFSLLPPKGSEKVKKGGRREEGGEHPKSGKRAFLSI